MTPPYDTGKVKIGLAYEPPAQTYMSRDAERIQSALLDKGKPFDLPLSPEWLWVIGGTAVCCLILSACVLIVSK